MKIHFALVPAAITNNEQSLSRTGQRRFKRPAVASAGLIAAGLMFAGIATQSSRLFGGVRSSGDNDATDVADIEPIDGLGNNLMHPTWGITGTDLIRLAKPGYADGIDSPSLPDDLSPRAISNLVNNQADPSDTSVDISTVDQRSLSDFGYAFGQFMDHDLDNTPDGGASLPIAVAAGDPIGPDPLPFTRSQTDPSTGTGAGNPAQQITTVTCYLDLSQVYGSSQVVAEALRTLQGGLLKTSPGNMLPLDNSTYFTADQIAALDMANDPQAVPESDLFAAGDRRANENIELTALETLFVRNHNRIAALLAAHHRDWSDEDLYQEARKLNIAQYQSIIYNEWIPDVLGKNALPNYRGYNPNVNATISNEFSTVAFRFGHSLVSPSIARDDNKGQPLTDNIPLAVDFFDPNLLNPDMVTDSLTGLVSTDIGPILKGDADGNGQAMDVLAISSIRNLLFGNGISGGQDLIALDVQRGRDHGIPNYNAVRIAVGLPAVTSFSQITSDEQVQAELEAAYPGGVNTIDAFEGGSAEDSTGDSDVGPLFQAIMADQFRRLRDGDRFFYLDESFDAEETAIFNQGNTLTKVIEANTNVTNLQSDAMLFHAYIGGTVTIDGKAPGSQSITLHLEDTSGDILGTVTTNSRGQYSFDELSGPATGAGVTPGVSATGFYVVSVVVPAGFTQVSPSPGPIEVVTGGKDITGVNFKLSRPTVRPTARR
jgi:peroxidase